MSFDPSRQLYPHSTCGTIPCSCTFQHSALKNLLNFTCKDCQRQFLTVNDLAEHRLDRHSSIPLDLKQFNIQEHRNGSV